MRKSSISNSRKFAVNPHMAVMVLLYLCLIFLVCWFALFRDYLRDFSAIGEWGVIIKTEDFKVFVFVAALVFANVLIIYRFSDQYFGVITVKDDCIIMHTPFKRRRKILYDEIHSIGIDIGTTGAFWVYISRTPIPMKYRNRINKIPLKECDIIFSYSDKAYKAMCRYMPAKISKKFAASASILRLYHYESR